MVHYEKDFGDGKGGSRAGVLAQTEQAYSRTSWLDWLTRLFGAREEERFIAPAVALITPTDQDR